MNDRPARPHPLHRSAFAQFVASTTRWNDNDCYGHINNAVYFTYFDTAVNRLLVEAGLLAIARSTIIGLVVDVGCTYFSSLAFPALIEVGVSAVHIGRSSVRYSLGVFEAGSDVAAAQGSFTHVYVVRATQRPVDIPPDIRAFLETLRVPGADSQSG